MKAQIGIFLLWSPWLFVFIKQASRLCQEFWLTKPGWDTVIQTLRDFLNATGPDQARQLIMIWILYALVLCLGMVHFLKKCRYSYFWLPYSPSPSWVS